MSASQTTAGICREIDTLNTYAWEQREGDRAASQRLSEKAQHLAAKVGYALGQAHSLIPPAFVAFREARYDKALEPSLQALGVLEAAPASVWRLRLYNLLGMIHFEIGERAEGLSYFEKQSSLSKVLNDREMEALAQHDIAAFYLSGEAQREAFEQALSVFEALNSSIYKAIALYNLGEYHFIYQAYETALTCLAQVLSTVPSTPIFDLQVITLGTQARCYGALGDETRALQAIEEAIALAQAHAQQHRLYCQLSLGIFHQMFGRHAEALKAFRRGLEFDSQNTISVLEGHRLLAECYAETGDYARAYEQQKRFQSLHDEIFKEESEQKVRALEVIHRTRSAQHEAALERARNAELRSYIAQLETLNAQVRELSVRDSLTGLYNRRYFSDELSKHFARIANGGPSLGLILLDIDHFKTINDTFGHAAGDAVLERVAQLLITEVRDSDIVARYGGEEFVILLPQHELGRTLGVAERIRARVEAEHWEPLAGSRIVTLSLGVAMSASCRNTDELLRLADARLYEAKRQGRNRVCAGTDHEKSPGEPGHDLPEAV